MKAAAGAGYSTATDLADWLVRTLKMPFREAHHVTGRIVAAAEQAGVSLEELPLAAMQAIEPRITKAVFGVLSVERSVASRVSHGGTAPANVRREAKKWLKRLGKKSMPRGCLSLAALDLLYVCRSEECPCESFRPSSFRRSPRSARSCCALGARPVGLRPQGAARSAAGLARRRRSRRRSRPMPRAGRSRLPEQKKRLPIDCPARLGA